MTFTCYNNLVLIFFYTDPLLLELTVSLLEEKVDKLIKRVDNLEKNASHYTTICVSILFDATSTLSCIGITTVYITCRVTNSHGTIATTSSTTKTSSVPPPLPPSTSSLPPPLPPSTSSLPQCDAQHSPAKNCLPIKIKDKSRQLRVSAAKSLKPPIETIKQYPKLVICRCNYYFYSCTCIYICMCVYWSKNITQHWMDEIFWLVVAFKKAGIT